MDISRKQLIRRMMESNRLAEIRVNLNLSQEALAEAVGTTARSISRWEHNNAFPQPYYLERLCQALNCTPEELFGSESEAPREIGLLAPLWHVPYPRNPHFTGREELLQTLYQQLHHKGRLALTQSWAINGLGGIGKTQIALEYAYRYRQDYRAIFWISAANHDTLLSGFTNIANFLRLPEKDDQNQKNVFAAVKHWLSTHQDWLMILDNADDVVMVQDVISGDYPGHLLLTTRAQALGSLAQSLEINTMSIAEGALFLLRRAKLLAPDTPLNQATKADLTTAEAIVTEMGLLPLALDQAGSYIEEMGCSLAHYLKLYRTRRIDLLRRRGHIVLDHPESLATTWSLNFQHVEQVNPAAVELLRLCAFLAPDTISEELIVRGASLLGESFQTIALDPYMLDDAIAVLRASSLIHREAQTQTLRIHRLVQVVVRENMPQQLQDVWITSIVHVLDQSFPGDSQQVDYWPWCEQLVAHVTELQIFLKQEIDPLAVASLLGKTAAYFKHRMRYQEEESYHKRALHVREQVVGSDHLLLVESLIGLAEANWYLNKHTLTVTYAQRAIDILEHGQETNAFALIKPLNFLAQVCRVQGAFAEAEKLLLRSLSIWTATHLGETGKSQRSDELTIPKGARETRALIQQALSLWAHHPQRAHDQIGHIFSVLSQVYQQQQRYEEAEAILLRQIPIGKLALGENHYIVAIPLQVLAEVRKGQGKLEEASQLYNQILSIREQALGPQHPQTLEARTVYTMLLQHRACNQQSNEE